MKFAPILAGGALALVLLTLATARPTSLPQKTVVLDLAGIDTLEVGADLNAAVEIRSDAPPLLMYPDLTDSLVRVRRNGARLVIEGKLDGYEALKVRVPASVHRFVIGRGNVRTAEAVAQAEVESAEAINWSGDAERLVLRDTRKPAACDCESLRLGVAGGKIGELRAYSPHGVLDLDEPDKIGAVYAWLGPKGSLTLSNARHFEQLHVMTTAPGEAPAIEPGTIAPR